MKDKRGVIYLETLIAFLPVFAFFLGTIQLADISVAHLIVQHASTTAARAAAVVLPDDGAYYDDRPNAQLHQFVGGRRLDIERAADLILRANPRLHLEGPNVSLDKGSYAAREDLTATVRARYHCLIPPLCGSGHDLSAESKLVYQGAQFEYEPMTLGDIPFNRGRQDTGRSIADTSDPRASEHASDPLFASNDSANRPGDPERPDGRNDPTNPQNTPDRPKDFDDPSRPNDPSRPADPDPSPNDPKGPQNPSRPTDPTASEPSRPGDPNRPSEPTPAKPTPSTAPPSRPPVDLTKPPSDTTTDPSAIAENPPASDGADLTKPSDGASLPALADTRKGQGNTSSGEPGEQTATRPSNPVDLSKSPPTQRPVDLNKPAQPRPQPVASALTPKQIEDALRRAGGCFIAGTGIGTPTGVRTIETIAVGDAVYAHDDAGREVVVGTVARTFVRRTNIIVDLTLRFFGSARDAQITGTANHPFYVATAGDYVPMAMLTPGTELLTLEGARARVVSLQLREGDFEVFNFQVAEHHNYYVLGSSDPPSAVLVHNQTNPCGQGNEDADPEPNDRPKPTEISCFPRSNAKISPTQPTTAAQRRTLRQQEEDRQLAIQQEALNKLSADEYVAARQAWDRLKKERADKARAAGRSMRHVDGRPEGEKALRDQEQKKVVDFLIEHFVKEEGGDPMDPKKDPEQYARAKAQAEKMVRGGATNALHTLDLVVGGDGSLHGLGNAGVNQHIGRQWKARERELAALAAQMQAEGRGSEPMRVTLSYCK